MYGGRAYGGTYYAQGDVFQESPPFGGGGDLVPDKKRLDPFLEDDELVALAAGLLSE